MSLRSAVCVLSLACTVVVSAHAGVRDQDSARAERRAELAERAQRAYERIVAAQIDPLATTADQVIDRCIAAMGGREALASLRTLSMTSNGFMVGGPFGGTRLLKAPNLIRQGRSDGSSVVTDGISVWRVEGDRWQRLSTDQTSWLQLFNISLDLLDPETKNVSYDFLGTVALEGGAFYKLRKTISTGKEVFIYFDISTGLLTMEEEFGDAGRRANLFFDHREVGGVLLPHMRVRISDVIDTAHVDLMSYEANPPLDDALFEPRIEMAAEGLDGRSDLEP